MRTIAIAQKVIKELLRDKRTLALMFVAPVFIMWLMNLMFSASTTRERQACNAGSNQLVW